MLSIVIPSRNEKYLKQTILDVLANATGEIEIFPVLDGYELPVEEIVLDPKVHYLRIPLGDGKCHKRQAINMMVGICHGEYVMSLDAHCMMAKGFDEQLTKDHGGANWVQVPRRYKLDVENWAIQSEDGRPPIDYEYVMFPLNYHPLSGSAKTSEGDYHPALHGWRWDERTLTRKDLQIDNTMIFQGSCWFMTKDWFKKMGFMRVEGYSGWGQEAEEISFSTWLGGGRVVTNKNAWYAHLHKNSKTGRMYFMSKESVRKCNNFSYDFWVNNRWPERIHDFEWLIEKFWPVPNWPEDWREQLAQWS